MVDFLYNLNFFDFVYVFFVSVDNMMCNVWVVGVEVFMCGIVDYIEEDFC